MRISDQKRCSQRFGFGLLEIVISVAVIFVVMVSLAQGAILFLRSTTVSDPSQRAVFLAQEGMDAVRFLRDVSWKDNIATSSVVVGNIYYIVATGSTWQITPTNPGTIQTIFTRTVVFNSVNRDASGNVVSSGGTTDPNTRKAVVELSWVGDKGQTATYSASAFITNFLNN